VGVHNELKNSPLPRALKKLLGVADADSGLERFGETLTPVFDMWSLPEFQYARGERSFAQSVISGAVAARFSAVALTNPATSRTIAVVTLVRALGGGNQIEIQDDTGTFSSIASNIVAETPRPLDWRPFQLGQTSVPLSQMLLERGDTAAGGNRDNYILQAAPPSGPIDSVDPQIVIVPGTTCFFFGTIVNTGISVQIRWRERRVIVPDELV
jgi:hypothetical protein